MTDQLPGEPRAYILGGNASTLALTSNLIPENRQISYRIRRAAVEASIACLTSLDTARALVTAFESESGPPRSLQEYQSFRVPVER